MSQGLGTCYADMGSMPPKQSAEATYIDKKYSVVREGLAEILTPASTEKDKGKTQTVFYNPIQQYNRDLSVLAVRVFAEDFAFVREQRQKRWKETSKRKDDSRKKEVSKGEKRKRGTASENDVAQEAPALKKGKSCEASETLTNDAGQHETGNVPEESGEVSDAGGVKLPESPKETERPQQVNGQPQGFRLKILDALSATGLRALRYGKELPCATHITANDLSKSATSAIRLNVEHNELQDKVQVSTSDAIDHMHHAGAAFPGRGPGAGLYHVIDLDPYGTAAPFLDAAVRALADGGLLCVTCTDAGVFASTGYLEKTYSQYGGLPLKGPHAHEGGIRLILHSIATAAARYGIAIEPLLSLSIDFYVRIFVRVHKSPAEVKFLASKTMFVYNCDAGCGAWSIQHLAHAKGKENRNGETIYKHTAATGPTANLTCDHCGFKTHLTGPMWGGPLHNTHFIERILDSLPSLDKEIYKTTPRIEAMLSIALTEDLALLSKLETSLTGPPSNASLSTTTIPPTTSPDRPVPPTAPEVRANHPFFITPPSLSRILHCQSPSDSSIRGALLKLGYRVSRSHTKPGSIVTDAPWSVIWEMMREWVRQKCPIKADALKEGTAGQGVMDKSLRQGGHLKDIKDTMKGCLDSADEAMIQERLEGLLFRLGRKEVEGEREAQDGAVDGGNANISGRANDVSKLDIVFDEELGRKAQGKKVVRYPVNPQPDWGPMSKAKS